MPTIYTQGYEGKTIEQFIALLKGNGVDLVVDVRLTPISRKAGFSKTAFRAKLGEAGIDYLHVRELGNPKRFRVEARTVEECLQMYEGFMKERWDEVLEAVLPETENRAVCLVCMEAEHTRCTVTRSPGSWWRASRRPSLSTSDGVGVDYRSVSWRWRFGAASRPGRSGSWRQRMWQRIALWTLACMGHDRFGA